MKSMLSKEFLDAYKEGKREFSDVIIQFADMHGSNLRNICIKDSKIIFVTFYDSDLSNAKFINCEIFWGSFYNCRLENAVFDNCKMDLTLFDKAIFNKTKIMKSKISNSGMFNTNIRELDMSTSSQFKVFTDPSQVTEKDVENSLALIAPFLDKTDRQIMSRIKEGIAWDVKNYNLPISNSLSSQVHKNGRAYSEKSSAYGGGTSSYGRQMEGLLHDLLDAYSQALQKKKTSYSQNNEYS